MPKKESVPEEVASQILEDQVIHVKRGRTNQFGFEPAWNAYFDFYLSSKYLEEPLLKLEDVTFHLFLRKNLNDGDPTWHMPSIRQMKRRLGVGQDRVWAMLERLEKARLLTKKSGKNKGKNASNVANTYELSDPIPTLPEFLYVARAGEFLYALREEFLDTPVPESGTPPVPDSGTPPVPESGTHKHTSFKQTSTETENTRARKTKGNQKPSTTQKPNDVVVALLEEYGIGPNVAKKLARDHSPEYIRTKGEYLEFLQAESPGKVKSPAAWLRRAIENDFSAPDGFVSAADREERLKEQKAREQAVLEAQTRNSERRRAEETAQVAREEAWRAELGKRYNTPAADLELWDRVLEEVQPSIGDFTTSLFQRCVMLQIDAEESVAVLGVPDDFALQQLSHPKLHGALQREFKRFGGQPYALQLVRVEPPQ